MAGILKSVPQRPRNVQVMLSIPSYLIDAIDKEAFRLNMRRADVLPQLLSYGFDAHLKARGKRKVA